MEMPVPEDAAGNLQGAKPFFAAVGIRLPLARSEVCAFDSGCRTRAFHTDPGGRAATPPEWLLPE
jgi:hypothetical protein